MIERGASDRGGCTRAPFPIRKAAPVSEPMSYAEALAVALRSVDENGWRMRVEHATDRHGAPLLPWQYVARRARSRRPFRVLR